MTKHTATKKTEAKKKDPREELDRVINCHFWAGALVQRHELDREIAKTKREHADANGLDEKGTHALFPDLRHLERSCTRDYVLTDWDRAWITARVADAYAHHQKARDEAIPLLEVQHEEHEHNELTARARDYFGGTHHETRAKLQALRDQWDREKDDAPHTRETIRHHKQALDQQIDLVARHIDTVKADVATKREHAQRAIDDHAIIAAAPENLAEIMIERVQNEIRALRADVAPEAAPSPVASSAAPAPAAPVAPPSAEQLAAAAPVVGTTALDRLMAFATAVEGAESITDEESASVGRVAEMLLGHASYHDVAACGHRLAGEDVRAVRDHLASLRSRDDLSDDETDLADTIGSAVRYFKKHGPRG